MTFKYTLPIFAFCAASLCAYLDVRAQSAGQWLPEFGSGNGINGSVYVLAADDSGHVYVGGAFDYAGSVRAGNIGKWTGKEWRALGQGLNGTVFAIAVSDSGEVVAGGEFTASGGKPVNGLATWNGTDWESFEGGIENEHRTDRIGAVYVIRWAEQGHLYIGGDFTHVGGLEARGIARWNGAKWESLGGGVDGFGCVDAHLDNVWDIEIGDRGELFAVGDFEYADTTRVNSVAQWIDGEWLGLGTGIDNSSACVAVYSIEQHGGAFYIGGSFEKVDAVSSRGIARWHGSSWEAVANEPGIGTVFAMKSDTSGLYVGGENLRASGREFNGVARLKDQAWSELDGGVNGAARIFAFELVGDKLYIGGESLTESGGIPTSGVAVWQISESTSAETPAGTSNEDLQDFSAFPNPASSETTLRFTLTNSAKAHVVLEIFDVLGRRLEVLLEGYFAAGPQSVTWSANLNPKGIYFARLTSGESIKVIIILTQ